MPGPIGTAAGKIGNKPGYRRPSGDKPGMPGRPGGTRATAQTINSAKERLMREQRAKNAPKPRNRPS